MKTLSIKTKADMERIISLLKEHGQMHVRGISRALEIHPMKVSRIIDNYLSPFLDIKEIKEFGLRIKLVKLNENKKNIILSDVLRYLELKKRIRSNK